jgi:hypothetical protein
MRPFIGPHETGNGNSTLAKKMDFVVNYAVPTSETLVRGPGYSSRFAIEPC